MEIDTIERIEGDFGPMSGIMSLAKELAINELGISRGATWDIILGKWDEIKDEVPRSKLRLWELLDQEGRKATVITNDTNDKADTPQGYTMNWSVRGAVGAVGIEGQEVLDKEKARIGCDLQGQLGKGVSNRVLVPNNTI